MTPKKKIVEDFEAGKAVPIQELAEEYAKETAAKNELIARSAAAPRLVAYAPFEWDGVQYEEGDTFTPPAGWTRDTAFDEFRSTERKNNTVIGMAFTVPGEILDKKTQERAYRREVLPLKEA